MSNVVILAGGLSNERAVSLRSAKAVEEALKSSGHQVVVVDYTNDLATHEVELQNTDVIFPVLHGKGGEDGELQAKLDKMDVAYVGSGAKSSALCFDKWQFKQIIKEAGLPTPDGELVGRDTLEKSKLFKQPFVLKPTDSGSSVDTLIVRNLATISQDVLTDLFSRHSKMLIEQLIEGQEITVGILGDQPLPVVEIIPPENGEFDYDNKYNGKTQELCPPKNVSQEIQKTAQEYALKIHKLCGCRDLSRTDIMVDGAGNLFILELNTMPGLTNQSLLPKAAMTAGIRMPEVCNRLIQMAFDRHKMAAKP